MILDNIDPKFCNDWTPTLEDSKKIRNRIYFKLMNKTQFFWRWNGKKLDELATRDMARRIEVSELFYV